MNFLEVLDHKDILIKKIQDADGLIESIDEAELLKIENNLTEKIDKYAWYRKYLKWCVDEEKATHVATVESMQGRLKNFDLYLKAIVQRRGKLQSSRSSINIRTTSKDHVVIYDFDICMDNNPEAVTIHTYDNVREIRLIKKVLLDKYKERDSDVTGYGIAISNTEWIDSRVKR